MEEEECEEECEEEGEEGEEGDEREVREVREVREEDGGRDASRVLTLPRGIEQREGGIDIHIKQMRIAQGCLIEAMWEEKEEEEAERENIVSGE